MNLLHTRNWIGWEQGTIIMPASPWIGLLGNSFTLLVRNLVPPFFPWAHGWNGLMSAFLDTSAGAPFRSIERFGELSRGMTDQTAGFGLLPLLLVGVSLIAARCARRKSGRPARKRDVVSRWVLIFGILGVLMFVLKLASWQNARCFTPYHPLVAAVVLTGAGQVWVTRQRWWRGLALTVMLSTVALLVVSRQRPLWPAHPVIQWAHRHWPRSQFAAKVARSFDLVPSLLETTRDLRAALPAGERAIGLVEVGFPPQVELWSLGLHTEAELWKPYGSRVIIRLRGNDPPGTARAMNIRFVIINDGVGLGRPNPALDRWLEVWRGCIVKTVPFQFDPASSLQSDRVYHVVRLLD
jgi:hypothetical protein